MACALTTSTAQAQPGSCDSKRAEYHQHRALKIIDHAYRHSAWRKASLVTNDDRRRLREHKFCLTQEFRHERIERYRDGAAESRKAWRARKREAWEAEQFRRQYTPYDCGSAGSFAIPCYIVACESHYSWSAYNSSGAAGVYQLMPEWNRPWPADTEAARRAHHIIASRLWAGGSGAGNWVCA